MSQSVPVSPGFFVPQALLLDERLTPLERNAWLAFRSLAGGDGTVVISYESLRGFLPSAPGSQKAALETVARAVLCLRLSTWIALVEYRRNPLTGFSMASRYVARDKPLAFDEACRADDNYLPLLERALGHASATVRQLARSILDVALLDSDALARLPLATQEQIRLLQQKHCDDGPDDSDGPPTRSNAHPFPSPRSTDTDIPKHAPAMAATVRTVENLVSRKVHTYSTDAQPQSEVPALALDAPARFHQLPPDQQRYLTARLGALPPQQRQAVLDEWNVRCGAGYVRNTIAYLYGLIKKALEGTFRLWAARKLVPNSASVKAPVETPRLRQHPPHSRPAFLTDRPVSREVAQKHIEQIRNVLKAPMHISQVIGELTRNGVLSKSPAVLTGSRHGSVSPALRQPAPLTAYHNGVF
ncbi:hypothetical protein ACG33_00090 [Steroidobacter denitrificans]|uniref:Uncharacterized protein n=1 Tax=Steroidobacter denitrificans TaxID=465721 RepID=A0A127F7F1_STEDE|nr:STY4528 family pathogenicity island replication protein [Steroidobacter denitrificans]AMN45525.1 hypothetical protein ACG33_00090 [Steroidobacter denitrificans]